MAGAVDPMMMDAIAQLMAEQQMANMPVEQVKRGFGSAVGKASKAMPKAAPPIPRAPTAPGGGAGDALMEAEAALNGTPLATIGTKRRAILDAMGLMARQPKQNPEPQPGQMGPPPPRR